MKFTTRTAAFAGAALALAAATPALAATNLALSSNGATFVSATSAINLGGYSVPISEANLLTDTPTQAYFNTDTRYIFDSGDTTESIIIDLGAVHAIGSFAANFSATDRVPGGLTIGVSDTDGNFTAVNGTAVLTTHGDTGTYTVDPASAASGRFIEYTFGACTGNNCGGAGVSQLFAIAAVPEPANWMSMIAGFGVIGLALRSRSKAQAAARCA